jgi:hypothetical protein
MPLSRMFRVTVSRTESMTFMRRSPSWAGAGHARSS